MTDRTQTEEGRLAVNLAVQRSRGIAFIGMYAVAMAGRLTGSLDFDYRWAHALAVTAFGSAVVFHELYRHGLDRRWLDLNVVWMACDVAFLTWMVYLTHGSSSLWLVWYLTNTAAAAFVAGGQATVRVAAANCVAYLLLLIMLGEIRGFDRALGDALIRLALLYAASFFFLRGIADLREKRLRIRGLAREKGQQLGELKRLTARLDRQASELADAHLRSQEASRAKSQFLANMSHELRTPLNSIIGFSEILGDKLEDRLEPRYNKFLRNILDSGRHLLGLINDILDLSKIEAGKMELSLEKISLGDVVHGVRSVMLGVVGHRGIELTVGGVKDLPPMVADGPKVKQILYNLVSNAIKFSPDGSTVRIAARGLSAEASLLGVDTVEIRVIDQGIGISPEDQLAIFEEFRQVDGEVTRAHGGTGLGLALVQRFAEMHGGIVSLKSATERGSTFTVCLPIDASQVILTSGEPEAVTPEARQAAVAPKARQRTIVPEARQATVAPKTRPREIVPEVHRVQEPARPAPATRDLPATDRNDSEVVLVVEDDEPFYRALAADLEGAGYRPRWAHHGDEALRLARELQPAAITLDLALPGMDGWEVLKALKDDSQVAHIPVIIVSLLENHELGFALGAEDYFLKPLERQHFLVRLEELLGKIGANPRPALIIDDDPQVHQLLEEELEMAGYEVLCAQDGASGLELAAARRPAIIVLDLMMPQMNGFEVAATLRDAETTANIPIIVLTAKELTAEDRERLHGKIQGVLSKTPMDRRLIVHSIREVENRWSAHE